MEVLPVLIGINLQVVWGECGWQVSRVGGDAGVEVVYTLGPLMRGTLGRMWNLGNGIVLCH